ncbi:ATP-dependent helicase [Paenibacillus sp. 1011MAR3C5]|uniref:UvrD-helicase domain-containing protein n=1 Tax=Paenibacillus sp. 1011MAR3C5 TaxID=1675787 RepID=UPI000E6C4AD1|nr:ATP-dependent helicase [Paenibacillus sp. 1011MAR3C5]RJE90898.1 ATP-dependent helicase [Paenibacillus sp. 1011MAR3C5]
MLSKLNPQQKEAVKFQENALVIACPGSGKTRVLTSKIAYELEKMSTKKKMVVALTYTNRAAEEISKRIDEMGISTEQLWAGTIHSFCFQWILSPYSSNLSELKYGFSIADEFMVDELKEQIFEEYNLPGFTEINTRINRQGSYDFIGAGNNPAEELHKRLLNNRMIDFDLLLYFSYQLLMKYPKISLHLGRIFTYILIDEFQDTQDLQYAIVGQIIKASQKKCKLFLVGDPNQAIYSSLGGMAKEVSEIAEEIGCEIKKLELSGNYRSIQRIIDYYTLYQWHVTNVESMIDDGRDKGIVKFNNTTHKDKLYQELATIIRDHLNKGTNPKEICVIAPRWDHLTTISRRLKSLLPDVPFDAPGLTPLPRSLDNFWYKLARLLLTKPSSKMYMTRMRWSKQILEEINIFTNTNYETNSKQSRKFLRLINGIKIDESNGILYLKQAFTLLFSLLNIDLEDHKVLYEHWESFFNGIERRYSKPDFVTLPKDISYFRSMFQIAKGVVVNTCHGVKGEEFDTVIAFGLLRGYVPHWNSIINQHYMVEEEHSKKLLYVIGSRAKRHLYMFAEKGRLTQSGNEYEVNRQLGRVNFEYNDSEVSLVYGI